MIRSIVGFHTDPAGDWVAELSCYHNRHVRHRPPFQPRPWVLDSHGRAAHVGSPIDCSLCERAELPDDLTIIGRAGPWDQDSVLAPLRRSHRTPKGRWGVLVVHDGTIGFQFQLDGTPTSTVQLHAGSKQSIPPEAPHCLIVTGPARLELELWGRAESSSTRPPTDPVHHAEEVDDGDEDEGLGTSGL